MQNPFRSVNSIFQTDIKSSKDPVWWLIETPIITMNWKQIKFCIASVTVSLATKLFKKYCKSKKSPSPMSCSSLPTKCFPDMGGTGEMKLDVPEVTGCIEWFCKQYEISTK